MKTKAREIMKQAIEKLGDGRLCLQKIITTLAGIIAALLLIVLVYGIIYGAGWLATCIILRLIALCFGLSFNWLAATGIWLILCLLKYVFKNS